MSNDAALEAFIERWAASAGAERANYARFLDELCDVIGVPRPDAATGSGGDYRYERGVTHRTLDGIATTRRIDLYKRGCFILEAKQHTDPPSPANLFTLSEPERRSTIRRSPGWTQAMLKAKGQAEGYAKDLPAEEGWPPFIALRAALGQGPATPPQLARRFRGAPRAPRLGEMLATLAALGQARPLGEGRYAA